MEDSFYFRATNAIGRIVPGDIVLVDKQRVGSAGSIVLASDMTLRYMSNDIGIIGIVCEVHFIPR